MLRTLGLLLVAAAESHALLPAMRPWPPPGSTRRAACASWAAIAFAAPAAHAAVERREELPPAAVMLRIAEVTDFQEGLLRRSAGLASDEERKAQNLLLGRAQLGLSVDILLKNTRLASLPGGDEPTLTLLSVKRMAQDGSGPLGGADLVRIADAYARARDELRVAFEALPAAEQQQGRAIARQLRAEDDERIRQAEVGQVQRALYGAS
jgi:hypothetical protein